MASGASMLLYWHHWSQGVNVCVEADDIAEAPTIAALKQRLSDGCGFAHDGVRAGGGGLR